MNEDDFLYLSLDDRDPLSAITTCSLMLYDSSSPKLPAMLENCHGLQAQKSSQTHRKKKGTILWVLSQNIRVKGFASKTVVPFLKAHKALMTK